MRTIFQAAALLTLLASFIFVGLHVEAALATEQYSVQDDKGRRKGRGKGRDDANKSNGNNNSNSNRSIADEARNAALARVPGTVIKAERENENGRAAYEFYIRSDRGETFEVYVDAGSNEVFKVEKRNK